VFVSRVLRRIFGPKRDEVLGEWSCAVRRFINCTLPQISLGRSKQGEWGGWGMWHTWGRKVYVVLSGKPDGKRPLERQRHRWDQTGYWGDMLGERGVDSIGSG
jgi:hypothetical protein